MKKFPQPAFPPRRPGRGDIAALLWVALLAGAATGCAESPETDDWVGRWNGPEGAWLEVSGSGGRYEITVNNLDGARTFEGRSRGDRIEFERDGTLEILRPTDGEGTGMKWLTGGEDCLTIRPGEGYCRD